jgi:hypothetical protein
MKDSENILKQFVQNGFAEYKPAKLPSTIKWHPDLIVSKNKSIYYVLLRKGNTILPTFLSRISNSSSKFNSIIVFDKKCSKADENEILSMGISIGYYVDNKLTLKLKTNIKQVSKEVKKKLTVIDIFVSSKQDISEREFVSDRIEMLRRVHSYPFNPPHLIEHDKFDMRKLKPYINSVMDDCEWFVIILEDNYSKIVSYELKKAIGQIPHDNIFMFVKSTKECHTKWTKELELIKALIPPTIKYLPYTDQTNLEANLTRAINLRMGQIYKKHKIKTTE